MYVVSVKSSKLKAILALFALVVFLTLAVIYITGMIREKGKTQEASTDLRAETAEERIAFLSQFGWIVEEEPAEVKEILIPESFDEVYERYNALQQEQGFDLSPYCGTRVKQWSYIVLNYPGYENNRDQIRANLLVSGGNVIGGDISNVALDGFMKTFDAQESNRSGVVDQEVTQSVDQ